MKVPGAKLSQIKAYLKSKVLKYSLTDDDFAKERSDIYDLFKRTLETGESNSVLLIGARGVGKTTLLNNVLEQVKKHKLFSKSGILVKLHGLVHTDDRLALKSITTQMQLDNAVGGKVFGSFSENLAFLLACLRTGKQENTKSVIFILDEFDLFCAHHNQTLLYNLFDVAQSAQTPICVFGVSSRLDVIELLEKRVKSRFSHRQMYLFPQMDFQLSKLEKLLSLEKDCSIPENYKKEWNAEIKELVNTKKFVQLIQYFQDMAASHRILENILFVVISKLSKDNPSLQLNDFKEEIGKLEKDEISGILQDLSTLELCLLIAMKHHVEIYDNQALNFEMVYTRYTKFTNRASNLQSCHRSVVMKAYEHLLSLELIAPVSGGTSRLQNEYQLYQLLVTPKQINEAIKQSAGLPTEVVQWANSSLV